MTTDARYMFYSKDKDFSDAEEKSLHRDDLIFNVTQDILVAMEDLEVSKAELAKRLSKSKSYVTQVLAGSRNMTLGSLADICFALGVKPNVSVVAPGFSRFDSSCRWKTEPVHISNRINLSQSSRYELILDKQAANGHWKTELDAA